MSDPVLSRSPVATAGLPSGGGFCRAAALIGEARRAAALAYAPYSHYQVGAALLTASGEVFTGCNVENASYGLTLCAERVAVFKAVSQGNTDFVALAIAGGSATAPAAPCGACRQVLAEFGKPDMSVWFAGLANGPITTTTLAELLPHSFALSPEK